MRPLFVVLGCADALRRARLWDAPPLGVWPAVEQAIEDQVRGTADDANQLGRRGALHFDGAAHVGPAGDAPVLTGAWARARGPGGRASIDKQCFDRGPESSPVLTYPPTMAHS